MFFGRPGHYLYRCLGFATLRGQCHLSVWTTRPLATHAGLLRIGLIRGARKMEEGMQDTLPWEVRWEIRRRQMALWRVPHCKLAVACLALASCACSSIQTPLPDLTPTVTSSISQPDRQKAVEELNKKGATHQQDAEKQIEESR